jgi:endonuclease/exonuclease/phosphatase (EEP) superfamily protein YafD
MIHQSKTDSRQNIRFKRWCRRIQWAYLAFLAVAVALLWKTGDAWWLGTVLCFGPRWIVLSPLPILISAALFDRRAQLLPVALSCLLIPTWLGFSFAMTKDSPFSTSNRFRVISFNAQGGRCDLQSFANFAEQWGADVIVFQESNAQLFKAHFPAGWEWGNGEGGSLIASRHPIVDLKFVKHHGLLELGSCLAADLQVGEYVVRVGAVHLPTPREGLEALVHRDVRFIAAMANERQRRIAISKEAAEFLVQEHAADVVAGDFNLPIESLIFQDYWGALTDAFSAAGFGLGYTKYTRWHGVRIDHVLIRNTNIGVISATVGPDVGSDHRPLLVELALPPPRKKTTPSRPIAAN